MNNKYIIFAFIILHSNLFGQYTVKDFPETEKTYNLMVSGHYGMYSNTIPVAFSAHVFNGNAIQNHHKKHASELLGKNNRFGYIGEADIELTLPYIMIDEEQHKTCIRIGYSHKTMLGLTFGKPALDLAMFGNARFVGDTVDMSGTKANFFQYDKLYLGASRSLGKKKQHQLTIAPFITLHKDMLIVDIERGFFFTSPDTALIEISLNGRYAEMGKSNRFQVFGGGIDMYYLNKTVFKKHLLQLSLTDFGLMQLKGNQFYFSDRNTFRYTGFELESVLQKDSLFEHFTDSLQSSLQNKEIITPKSTLMPFQIQLLLQSNIKQGIGISGQLHYAYLAGYLPYVELIPHYSITSELQLGLICGFGGFGHISNGIQCSIRTASLRLNASVLFHSNYTLSPLLTGFSGNLQCVYQFTKP